MSDELDRIVRLDELDDFAVADGDPDVRGWSVDAADGTRLGAVAELLVDIEAMKVRYLDIAVARELLDDDEPRHILLPIGYARLAPESERVLVDRLAADDLRRWPAYEQDAVTRDYEARLRPDDAGDAPPSAADFYAGPAFETERFWRVRRG
jgi:photosynthetic reaction center H subunit